jgi:hypothetical protein
MAPPLPQQTAARVAPVPQKQTARDVINIVVMVGGTVDPINSDPKVRSASYRNPTDSSCAAARGRRPTQHRARAVRESRDALGR